MPVVRDEHQRALELRQRHRQRLACFQIEMVGGLVEQQQIRPLPDEQRERKARLLAAGEVLDRSGRHLARKIEASQIVAQLLLPDFWRELNQVPERRLVVAQHLDLVLGEIADHQSLVHHRAAAKRRQHAGDGLDERGLAGAVDAEEPNALARAQHQLDFAQYRLVAITRSHVFQHQQRIRRAQRLAELERERRRGVHRRELFHAREHLHAALCLARLGGLGAEAVDERLQVLALALLLLVLALREHQALRALLLERRIVAGVAPELAPIDVHDRLHHPVQEIAVVRHHHQRAGVAPQPILQPDDRIEIEVVGRLVEQQQVRAAHQRLREVEPHAPAAREARDGLVELLRGEAEAEKQCLGARAHGVGVGIGERRVQLAHQRAIPGRLRGSELGFQVAQRRIAIDRALGRRPLERRGLLRHVGDAPVRREFDLALVGVQLAAQQGEETRLARAVGADQPDALAGIEGEVSAFEERLRAARERDLGEADQAPDSIGRLPAPDLLPGRFLLLEEADDVPPLEARQQERQPAERRMAEGEERAAGELVQFRAVARVVQRLDLLQLRRLGGDRGTHLLADLREHLHQRIEVLGAPFFASRQAEAGARLGFILPLDRDHEHGGKSTPFPLPVKSLKP